LPKRTSARKGNIGIVVEEQDEYKDEAMAKKIDSNSLDGNK
jgi:hypothetical protein